MARMDFPEHLGPNISGFSVPRGQKWKAPPHKRHYPFFFFFTGYNPCKWKAPQQKLELSVSVEENEI